MQNRRKLIKQIGAAAMLPTAIAGTNPVRAQSTKTVRLADQTGSEIDYAAV